MALSKNDLNQTIKLNQTEPDIKQSFFKNYNSYNIYYKAQTLTNNNLNLILCRSYHTDIAIYNKLTDVLYLNLDWYNCSKTTTEQLDHFLNYLCNLYNKLDYTKILYLNDKEFNEITEIFYNTTNFNKYLEVEGSYLKRFYRLKTILKKLDQYTNFYKTWWDYWSFDNNPVRCETIELKTRIKKIKIYNYDGLQIEEVKTYKRTKKEPVISGKLNIINDYCLIFDRRKSYDKKLYTGYDMGVTNTKKDFI